MSTYSELPACLIPGRHPSASSTGTINSASSGNSVRTDSHSPRQKSAFSRSAVESDGRYRESRLRQDRLRRSPPASVQSAGTDSSSLLPQQGQGVRNETAHTASAVISELHPSFIDGSPSAPKRGPGRLQKPSTQDRCVRQDPLSGTVVYLSRRRDVGKC